MINISKDLKSLDSEILHEPPSTSNFEKLFTTNKYRIVEDSGSGQPITKSSTDSVNPPSLNLKKDKKTKPKKEPTSKTKEKKETKKQKASQAKTTNEPVTQQNDDDLEIIEVPPPKENTGDKDLEEQDYAHQAENFFQNQNLMNNPNDLLQSYLMLQAANPSLAGGFDQEQYERIAQEIMKMGGNPQHYFGTYQS